MNHSDIAESALKKLKSLNIDAAEISMAETKGFSVTARLGDVETLEHHFEKTFSVTVFQNQCTGSASSSDFSDDSLTSIIEKACSIARFSHPDRYAGLADSHRLVKQYPNCELYHFWNISPQDAIALAIDCEKKAFACDKRIVNSEGASVSTLNSSVVYANTLGFLGEYQVSEHSVSCSVVASENNQMQRDDEYTVARNPIDLKSTDFIAQRAAEKTIQRLGARKIKTQICPVIFEASIAKSIWGALTQAISGGNLYRQSSFLLNALGKSIFPTHINIFQQPHLLSAMGSRPFDSEGVKTVDQHYVRKGELVSYILGSYSARKLDLQSTGNAGGVFNLSVSGSAHNIFQKPSGSEGVICEANNFTLPQLIKKMHRGLLVTELMGQGINITTGDYSRGASGFWIDHGEIQFPVEEITIASNLKNIFLGVVAIADDIDVRGSIRTGSVLIDQMTVGGE